MTTDIDRTSPVPIYHQLKTLIQERIESGLWRPGDRIPTERELCQTHDISRSPVRQALSELAHEGLLIRRPGLGTFVDNHVSIESSSSVSIQMMCSDPHWTSVLDHVSRVWNAEHPSQPISFEIHVVAHSDFYSLLNAAVGSGTAPDVAMVDSVWVAGLTQAGFLYPLEDLSSEWNRSRFGDDLYPSLVEANSFEDKLYGLPVKADASTLWYRRDWFAEQGLAPPRTWDDLLSVAPHFLDPQIQKDYALAYPLAFPGGTSGGESTVYSLMPFIWSAGGEIFDAHTECVTIDSPGTRRALGFLRELIQRGVSPAEAVSFTNETSPILFANGSVAMALGGSYEGERIREASGWGEGTFVERVGSVPPPAAPGGDPVSTVGGTSYVILRQCERPGLVMDVLKVATDPSVIGDLYRPMWLNLPSPSFDALLGPDADPLLIQTSRMIASGRARPSIPEYVKVSRQLQAMFEAVIASDEAIDDIARRTAEFIGVIAELPCQSS